MKIENEKLESVGFHTTINISSDDLSSKNRKIAARILSASFTFNLITKKGYADYVKINKTLLSEFNQDEVGDLRVIHTDTLNNIIVGRKDCKEFIQIDIQ